MSGRASLVSIQKGKGRGVKVSVPHGGERGKKGGVFVLALRTKKKKWLPFPFSLQSSARLTRQRVTVRKTQKGFWR